MRHLKDLCWALLCLLLLGCSEPTEGSPAVPGGNSSFATWDGVRGQAADATSGATTGTREADASRSPRVVDASRSTDAGSRPGTPDTEPATGDATGSAPTPCEDDEDCEAITPTNPCRVSACSPVSGQCVEIDAAPGTACDNADPCYAASCVSGVCTDGAAVDCADTDPCTLDTCDPAVGCVNQPDPDCCLPSCAGKVCGDDGCGGSCGTCPGDLLCDGAGCVDCLPGPAGCCDDGNCDPTESHETCPEDCEAPAVCQTGEGCPACTSGWDCQYTTGPDGDLVSDSSTGLDWELGGSGATSTMTLSSAQSYCGALGGAWRLPTQAELISLCGSEWVYPNGVWGTTLDVETFPDWVIGQSYPYWTSDPNYPCCHWAFSPVGCDTYSHTCCPNPSNDPEEYGYVRCVRSTP